jgi:hypothetical protein
VEKTERKKIQSLKTREHWSNPEQRKRIVTSMIATWQVRREQNSTHATVAAQEKYGGGTGEMMFQNFITVVMVLVSMTIGAAGLPLASWLSASSAFFGFGSLPLVF